MSLFHDVPEPNELASAEFHGARDLGSRAPLAVCTLAAQWNRET